MGTTLLVSLSRRVLLPAVLVSTALLSGGVLSGCAAENDLGQTAAQEEPGGESAAQAEVSKDVTVTGAALQRPADGVLAIGDDAVLGLVVSNTGGADDELLQVSGPEFGVVEGGPWTVPSHGELTSDDAGPTTVTLPALTQGLAGGETVQVTFAFERSGDVTLTVPYAG